MRFSCWYPFALLCSTDSPKLRGAAGEAGSLSAMCVPQPDGLSYLNRSESIFLCEKCMCPIQCFFGLLSTWPYYAGARETEKFQRSFKFLCARITTSKLCLFDFV